MESPRVIAGTGKTGRRLARAATIVGGTLSFSALALGSAQFYRVSSARLGPGAMMLAIPKILAASLAPFSAVAGAAGAACGLSALWLERGKVPKTAKTPSLAGTRALGLGVPLVVLAGLTATAMSAVYTQQVLASRGDFAAAFGTDWQEHIPSHLKGAMLPQR